MILQLIRRDLAWKGLPYVTLFIAIVWMAGSHLSGEILGSVLGFATALPGFLVVMSQPEARGYLAALPITVRDIYLARVISMLLTVWLPLAAGVAGALLAGFGATETALPVLFSCAAISTLTLVIMQTVLIRQVRLAVWLTLIVGIIGLGPGPAVLLLAPPGGPVGIAIVVGCAVATVLLIFQTWKTMRPSFLIAPRTGSWKPVWILAWLLARTHFAPSSRVNKFSPLLRSLYPWGMLLVLPFLIIQTVIQTSLYPAMNTGFTFPAARWKIRWLLTLPVSRSRLLLASVAPLLLVLSAGYLAGVRYLSALRIHPFPVVSICGRTASAVPLEFWLAAPAGKAPLQRAPWGETSQPPVARIAGQLLYNPYSAGCENTRRFFEWQFTLSRAANAQGPGGRIQIVHLASLVGLALITFLLILLNDWYPMRRLRPVVRHICLFGTAAGLCILTLSGPPVTRSAEDAMAWLSWALPGNWLVLVLLPLAALYWALDKVFREAEFADTPPAPSRDGPAV